MSNEISAEGLMAMALQGLGIEYRHVRAESGESLWHVPIGSPSNTVLTLFVGPFTAGVTCVVGNVPAGQVPYASELLRLSADLTLAKVALRKEHLYVQAEVPTDEVNDKSLKLAITSVLDAVKQVKAVVERDLVHRAAA